jgi:hypothetical protein
LSIGGEIKGLGKGALRKIGINTQRLRTTTSVVSDIISVATRRRAVIALERGGRFVVFLESELRRQRYRVVRTNKEQLSWPAKIALLRKGTLFFQDSKDYQPPHPGNYKVIDIEYDCFSVPLFAKPLESGTRFVMPYFMHPHMYQRANLRLIKRLRSANKDVLVSFAGTSAEEKYKNNFKFPILDRHTIICEVRNRFSTGIQYITDKAEVTTKIDKPVVLCIVDEPENNTDKYVLPTTDYLILLARSKFFLCPPGFCMPFSHNIIEAMTLGAIPITNYSGFFHPPLEHNVNCLAFDDLEGLYNVINRALLMDEAEISQLRQGVMSYSKDNFNLCRLFNALETKQRITLVTNNEVISVNRYVQE